MKKSLLLLLPLAMALAPDRLAAQGGAASWEPARINKVVELLDMGQPVYYEQLRGGGGYDEGMRLAQTEADFIVYNIEHSFLNVAELREFMRGLVDGGPTPSGHRTPAVIVVLPAIGWTEASMRANTWMVQYVMAAGVHGLFLPQAVDPAAVRLMIEAIRYPFAPPVDGLGQGMRGAGSQGYAAEIWGIPASEYLRVADPWPMNPNGEVIIGVKIENGHGLQHAEMIVRVPGVLFGYWGPGDMAFWYGGPGASDARQEELQAARERIFQATRDAGRFFLDTCSSDPSSPLYVVKQIDDGLMLCTGAEGRPSTQIGREYTGREMPW